MQRRQSIRVGAIAALGFMLAACGDGGGDTAAAGGGLPVTPPASGALPTTAGNRLPTLSGAPAASALIDAGYSFTPTANDPDTDVLTFAIANAPPWASFDTATGELSGTPRPQDVGTTRGIVISASDGELTASLAAFDLTVQAMATGSVTLTWTPPTENTDGTPLTNLAGYRIYWGTAAAEYPYSVVVDNAGLTSYVVENLLPGTYFFVATALNRAGLESSYSAPASKTVR